MTFPVLPSNTPASGGGYSITNSLRFRGSASANLTRTFAGAGNGQTWTWSGWVKRGNIASGVAQVLFNAPVAGQFWGVSFDSGNHLRNAVYDGSTDQYISASAATYTDPSAWYHVVAVLDTTNATAANRARIYMNGVQITTFSTQVLCSLNYVGRVNTAVQHQSGTDASGNQFDGYMTEVNFIDGQALDPSYFGAFDSVTGVWQPIEYTGTYGTNGFYLPFTNTASPTTLGYDFSGNGNNWTPNNISTTAGFTYDAMTDVPTLTSKTQANYPTFNPNIPGTATTYFANLYISANNNVYGASSMQFPSGKWYFEYVQVGYGTGGFAGVGICANTSSLPPSSYCIYQTDGTKNINGTSTAYGSSYGAASGNSDVVGVLLDNTAGTVEFYLNNVSQGVITHGLGSSLLAYGTKSGANGGGLGFNFGQQPFTYTPPTGFVALNTYNLPDPTIANGAYNMDAYLYTGNGTGQQVGQVSTDYALYNLPASLRTRSSAGAYLNRTPATTTNQQTWTWSGWVKRGNLTTTNTMFYAYIDTNNLTAFRFDVSGTITFFTGASLTSNLITVPVFLDPSEWYHTMIAVDTTQATASNRVKIYVNGSQITSFSTASYPAQNLNTVVNSTNPHLISNSFYNEYFDGYMAEVNFVDGQALLPSQFGQFDGNGAWLPKQYTGTYGTNGFHLQFGNNSSVAALGTDTSGNGNTWTVNNVSLTAGSTYDWMQDVPAAQSTSLANYSVMNPSMSKLVNLSNGNLQVDGATGSGQVSLATMPIPSSGKFYWEVVVTNAFQAQAGVGCILDYTSGALGSGASSSVYYYTGATYVNGSATASVSSYTNGDILGVALDAATGNIWYAKNGVWQNSGDPAAGTGYLGSVSRDYAYYPASGSATNVTFSHIYNFGQQPFQYTPPTDFLPLNNYNVVTPGVITPSLVWIKSRSAATNHTLFDQLTGVENYLISNSTATVTNDTNSLQQFNEDGFYVGSSSAVNNNGSTYVAWCWKGGNNPVTNTNGSITSTVSANPTAGFSVVSYTGNGASPSTVGHGLGVAPAMMIFKSTSNAYSWDVYHQSLGSGQYLYLNATDAAASSGWLNNTAPGASVFTLSNFGDTNGAGNTYIAYCWAAIPGYSAFGSYTGNGSTNGPFVYLGFRPRWIMVKRTDSADSWCIVDSSMNPYNLTNYGLVANTNDAQGTGYNLSYLSNGFSINITGTAYNANGSNYIYAAFAENPFKYANAR